MVHGQGDWRNQHQCCEQEDGQVPSFTDPHLGAENLDLGTCRAGRAEGDLAVFHFWGLPGIGWGISCARSEGDRIEVKAAEMEEDRHFKPLAVSEPSSEDFD